jgi:hypothetical protein
MILGMKVTDLCYYFGRSIVIMNAAELICITVSTVASVSIT